MGSDCSWPMTSGGIGNLADIEIPRATHSGELLALIV